MEKKSIFTIFPKLLITMLVVALIPAMGLWYLNYTQAQKDLKVNLEQNLSQLADVLSTQVNAWIEMNDRSSQQIARTEDVISMDPDRQFPLLKATDDTYEWSYAAFTTDLKGNAIMRSDGKKLKFYGDREYIKQVLRGKKVGQQVLISRVNGKPALCLSAPIKADRSLVGVLVQCSKLTNISKAVTDVKLGTSGLAFLVDSKGRLIAHGDETKVTDKLEDYSKHPAFEKAYLKDHQLTFEADGKESIAKVKEVALGWKLVVQQDVAEAFAPLHAAQRNALWALGATVVFVTLMAMILAGGLAKPIRKLTAIADDYSRGELNARIPGQNRGDEIGALARAIDRLGFSFKMALQSATTEESSTTTSDRV